MLTNSHVATFKTLRQGVEMALVYVKRRRQKEISQIPRLSRSGNNRIHELVAQLKERKLSELFETIRKFWIVPVIFQNYLETHTQRSLYLTTSIGQTFDEVQQTWMVAQSVMLSVWALSMIAQFHLPSNEFSTV